MIQDTLQIVWADERPPGGGGHIHHALVTQDGSIIGPQKVADLGTPAGYGPPFDESRTSYGLAHPAYGFLSLAFRPAASPYAPKGVLYCIWSQPPVDSLGEYTDMAADPGDGQRPNRDIFRSASSDGGRTWTRPANLTQTNHPGCDGISEPCEAETYVSAAALADSVIYILAHVDKFPGWQSLNFPPGQQELGPDTRLANEWRIYLAPARDPAVQKGDLDGDGFVKLADIVLLLDAVFLGTPAVNPFCAGDMDDDGDLTASDVVLSIICSYFGAGTGCGITCEL